MTTDERFATALVRVQHGESIKEVVADLYKYWRLYKRDCTDAQRAQLKAARCEYTARYGVSPKITREFSRINFLVGVGQHASLLAHCQKEGITVTKFIRKAIAAAMAKK